MDAQIKELLLFLHDRNPQVRQIALANLLGHTPAGSPNRSVFFTGLQSGGSSQSQTDKDPELVRDMKLLCRDQLATAHDAFRALVNLSDSPLWVRPLSEVSFLVFLVSYILSATHRELPNIQHPPSVLADLASMLLSNLTAQQSVCATLLSLKVPVVQDSSLSYRYYPLQSRCSTSPTPPLASGGGTVEVDALPLLIDAFASGAKIKAVGGMNTSIRKGELHFLSSVFANLSVTPAGRLFFVTPRSTDPLQSTTHDTEVEYPLSKLTSFTEHTDRIRRGGVASLIKNCSFHIPAHRAILSPEETQVTVAPSTIPAPAMNILPAILLPLAGPEEFDLEDQDKLLPPLQLLPPTKKREPDSLLRLTHVETLILLCTTRWGREFLRESGAYEIVRMMHETEPADKVSEHIERLVNLLKRDEGDGDDVDIPEAEAVSDDEKIEEV